MSDHTDFESRLKRATQIVAVVICVLITLLFIIFVGIHASGPNSWVVDIAKNHFAAVIGLPFAALLSFLVVTSLKISFGTIEFNGLGFTFRGASGPIVLWVVCFLAMTLAVRLLW